VTYLVTTYARRTKNSIIIYIVLTTALDFLSARYSPFERGPEPRPFDPRLMWCLEFQAR